MESSSIIKMKLVFDDEKKPYFLDVSSLFYDFELLHDFSLLLFAKEYDNYRFSKDFWCRRGRGLKDEHRLRALKIIKESPLTVELILSIVAVSSGAIWAIVQAIEKIGNGKLPREKLKLQIEKLKHENNILCCDEQKARSEMDNRLRKKECSDILDSLLERLRENPIKLRNVDLTSEIMKISEKTPNENYR